MTTQQELVLKVVQTIALRNRCYSGLEGKDWILDRAMELVEEGFWNDSQIGEIVGYARQAVSNLARSRQIQRPTQVPLGGKLSRHSLDVILTLQGYTMRGTKPPPGELMAAISTGTSTKLISRLTGIPIGVVLYNQRKLKKLEAEHGTTN